MASQGRIYVLVQISGLVLLTFYTPKGYQFRIFNPKLPPHNYSKRVKLVFFLVAVNLNADLAFRLKGDAAWDAENIG